MSKRRAGENNRIKGPCLVRIKTLYPQLTQKERVVADYVMNHDDVIYRSITEVVRLSKAGYGTVTRFCKRLGYSGFQDFKIHLSQDVALRSQRKLGVLENSIEDVAQDAITGIQDTATLLSERVLDGAAKALSAADMVIVVGCAGSAVSAAEIDYRLTRFGISSVGVSDNHIQRIRATLLPKNGVLVLVSFSGTTKELMAVAEIAKKAGAKLVCLTNYAESPLAEMSDYVLLTALHVDPLRAEIVSKVPMGFVIDVLFRRIRKFHESSEKMLARTSDAVSERQL